MDNLYNHHDSILLKQNIDKITEQIKIQSLSLFKPSVDIKLKIHDLILAYIRDNKRKIYGGYAINKLLQTKGVPSIYKEYEIPDIDFYSPDPNHDVIKLCNSLVDTFTDLKVSAREAKHPNTYSIFVNFELYCDITYMPKNVYNKLPFVTIDNIIYTHPNFILIDCLKIMTDPIYSYWRIEKAFSRLILLQEHFPVAKFIKPINIGTSDNYKVVAKTHDNILASIQNKDIIIVGFYAYNYFLKISRFWEANRKISQVDIPYLEIISKNYRQDFELIMDNLKKTFPSETITHSEYHPFFNFTGHSVEIYVNNELVLIIYDYDNRCVPYINISNNLKLGTFTLNLLYGQINVMKYRIIGDEDIKLVYMIMVSHLIQMRNYYLSNTRKTIMDNTPFRDFVVTCIGPDTHQDHSILLKYEARRAKNKPSLYIYDPHKNRKEEKDPKFSFPNISGNIITNEKRLVLTGNNNLSEEEDDDNGDGDGEQEEVVNKQE